MALLRSFGGKSPVIDPSVFMVDDATVIGDVVIGEGSSLWFGAVVRGDVNYIRIGARTNLQDHCVVHVTSGKHPTVIGDEVTLGHRVTLHGCTVGNRCLLGIGAIVMDRAVISNNCMVAAGALVPPGMVVPEGTLAIGSPAKIKRDLTAEELAFLKASADNYLRYVATYRAEGWGSR